MDISISVRQKNHITDQLGLKGTSKVFSFQPPSMGRVAYHQIRLPRNSSCVDLIYMLQEVPNSSTLRIISEVFTETAHLRTSINNTQMSALPSKDLKMFSPAVRLLMVLIPVSKIGKVRHTTIKTNFFCSCPQIRAGIKNKQTKMYRNIGLSIMYYLQNY